MALTDYRSIYTLANTLGLCVIEHFLDVMQYGGSSTDILAVPKYVYVIMYAAVFDILRSWGLPLVSLCGNNSPGNAVISVSWSHLCRCLSSLETGNSDHGVGLDPSDSLNCCMGSQTRHVFACPDLEFCLHTKCTVHLQWSVQCTGVRVNAWAPWTPVRCGCFALNMHSHQYSNFSSQLSAKTK